MKTVVNVPEIVPLSVCIDCQRSVDDEPPSGLGATFHPRELSHQYVDTLVVSVGANGKPNCVQLKLGADGDPPPLTE